MMRPARLFWGPVLGVIRQGAITYFDPAQDDG